MADLFELSAELRQGSGKGASRRMRRLEDKVPAVIYGGGKENASVVLEHRHIAKALENEAFYSHILTFDIGGKKEKVVLKALQRHPSKLKIMHADFLRISATEKLTMNIPLHFTNEDIAPGIKLEKGAVSRLANDVEIRCLPADLPEYIEVDMSELNMDESIHLSQVKVPKGVEFVALSHDQDPVLVNIHKPHVIEEEEPVEAESAEVPVIGEEGEEQADQQENEAHKEGEGE